MILDGVDRALYLINGRDPGTGEDVSDEGDVVLAFAGRYLLDEEVDLDDAEEEGYVSMEGAYPVEEVADLLGASVLLEDELCSLEDESGTIGKVLDFLCG